MSQLRPTLKSCNDNVFLRYEQTYFRVWEAVKRRRALIHGKLEDCEGGVCAIGAYFKESKIAIDSKAIDEIAAYNDSFPRLTPAQRWRKVLAWLRSRTETPRAK